jgi:hypothetical protein
MNASVAAPASSRVMVEARMASVSPLLVDDEVGSLGDDVQFVVGDDGGDLDDHVHRRIEAGHLQVHPHEHDRQH